jgi:hypothetical protein
VIVDGSEIAFRRVTELYRQFQFLANRAAVAFSFGLAWNGNIRHMRLTRNFETLVAAQWLSTSTLLCKHHPVSNQAAAQGYFTAPFWVAVGVDVKAFCAQGALLRGVGTRLLLLLLLLVWSGAPMIPKRERIRIYSERISKSVLALFTESIRSG